ncbi:hypothetical protein E4T56_gene10158 [Termitomyces sp. T112]|nr:hypothetical protein E4T56_gene10158 [Termitomyces sp. T112]
MFFGLTNSPATFQTMMNNIFQNLIAEGTEHCQIMCLVLECLCHHQLYFKPEKSAEMDLVKVVSVVEWLEPKNKKEVQAFLGFANFH